MSEWQRGCSLEKAPASTNSRNFERDGGRTSGHRGKPSDFGGSDSGGWRGREGDRGERDSRPCHAFQRGECRNGTNCRFSHQPPAGPSIDRKEDKVDSAQSAITPLFSESDTKSEPQSHIQIAAQASPHKPKRMRCPPTLFRSRDSLFNGITLAQRKNIVMDKVASFSVTESQMANKMTDQIMHFAEQKKPNDNVIFDGMACVGGNTISFAQSFETVLANEYDQSRYDMLRHNVTDVLGIQNVTFLHGSILDLGMTEEYDVLFLDPEWGGPDYKFKKLLRLTISDTPVEDFCMAVMTRSRVHTIALKLPVNYDNKHLQRTAEERGLTYSLFTNYQKMTLTILQK